jgi:hypothetical protein
MVSSESNKRVARGSTIRAIGSGFAAEHDRLVACSTTIYAFASGTAASRTKQSDCRRTMTFFSWDVLALAGLVLRERGEQARI